MEKPPEPVLSTEGEVPVPSASQEGAAAASTEEPAPPESGPETLSESPEKLVEAEEPAASPPVSEVPQETQEPPTPAASAPSEQVSTGSAAAAAATPEEPGPAEPGKEADQEPDAAAPSAAAEAPKPAEETQPAPGDELLPDPELEEDWHAQEHEVELQEGLALASAGLEVEGEVLEEVAEELEDNLAEKELEDAEDDEAMDSHNSRGKEVKVEQAMANEANAAVPAHVEAAEDLGPLIGIYKPVSPYEVYWEIIDATSSDLPVPNHKGVLKVKRKVAKGRCSWRNPVGFLGSCQLLDPHSLEPWPNEVLAVYTTMQGGDSKELSWVDGVTVLNSEGDGLLAFTLLISFLRSHQELQFEVDLQDGLILALRGPGGMEFRLRDNQVLFIEDVQCINKLRVAISEAFYTAASPVPTTVDTDQGIDFSGTRGRRDDEPVPQIAQKPEVLEALQDLIKVVRDADTRAETMDPGIWEQRRVLHNREVKYLDMHGGGSSSSSSSFAARAPEGGKRKFELFKPLRDLQLDKEEAERRQKEDEERRYRLEEERRRKKEEEKRFREEAKRNKKTEERWAAKAAGKGAQQRLPPHLQPHVFQQMLPPQYGHPNIQELHMYAQEAAQERAKGKGREKKEKPPKKEKQAGKKGGKGGGKGDAASSSTGGYIAYEVPNLPPGWLAVPDDQSQRMYYWNPTTNEVSWTLPPMPLQMQAYPPHMAAFGMPTMGGGAPSAFGFALPSNPADMQGQRPGANFALRGLAGGDASTAGEAWQ